MQEPVLNPLSNLANQTSAVNTINANSVTTATALQNTLDRYGSSPNQMQSVLDMNNYNVINLPAPATINSPARLIDVTSNPTISVPTVGTSGSTVPLLNGNNTWTGTQNFSGATVISATLADLASVTFTGSISGTTILQPSAVATGTLTLPATTDTLQGAATTATFTNKTYDTGGTGNSFLINGNAITSITGSGSVVLATSPAITTPTITNQVGSNGTTSATTGAVGEIISSTIALGSAMSVTDATALTITSILLSAGDWQVIGTINYLASAAAQVQFLYLASLSTSSSVDLTNGRYVACSGGGNAATGTGLGTLLTYGITTSPVRFLVTSPTTINLVGQSHFTTSGTQTAYGTLFARRMR